MATITNFNGLGTLAFVFISCSVYAQQNTETKLIEQQSNGVKVYEQTGVTPANFTIYIEQAEQAREVRSLSDWSLGECEEAIDQISEKITFLSETEGNSVQIITYQDEIGKIRKHMSTLTSK